MPTTAVIQQMETKLMLAKFKIHLINILRVLNVSLMDIITGMFI